MTYELPLEEKIKAVTEVILEPLNLDDMGAGVTMGWTIGLLTALRHPEWAAAIKAWLETQNPPDGTTVDTLGDIYVQNIPLESLQPADDN